MINYWAEDEEYGYCTYQNKVDHRECVGFLETCHWSRQIRKDAATLTDRIVSECCEIRLGKASRSAPIHLTDRVKIIRLLNPWFRSKALRRIMDVCSQGLLKLI